MYRPAGRSPYSQSDDRFYKEVALAAVPTFHRRSPRSAIPPSHTSLPRHRVSIEFVEIPRVPRLLPDLAARRVGTDGTVQEGERRVG